MADGVASTRALLVEDDPNIVDLIRSNLSVRGFDTIVSADGARALQLLETEAPDIVLLDLMLPEADGFELCRQIRERSAVGIIVVSARGGERDKVTALHVGADDYLTKPFSIEELLARIVATLRRTRPAVAQEAALKCKETCGLHAESFSSAEVRHGPQALLRPGFPALLLAQADETRPGVEALGADLVARGVDVIVAGADIAGATVLAHVPAHPAIAPMLAAQAFYRAANALAIARGRDPDEPPHLSKVTRTM